MIFSNFKNRNKHSILLNLAIAGFIMLNIVSIQGKSKKPINEYAQEIRKLKKNDTYFKKRLEIKSQFIRQSLLKIDSLNLTGDIQNPIRKVKTNTLLSILHLDLIPLTKNQAPKIHKTIESLAKKLKIKNPIIFLSGDTKLFNAMAAGFGKDSSIVIIGYKLLKYMSKEEFEAVMAHELSHIKHNHTLKTMFVSIALSISILFIANEITNQIKNENKLLIKRIANFIEKGFSILIQFNNIEPEYIMALTIMSMLTTLLKLKLSRIFEKQADLSALTAISDKESIINLMERFEIFGKEKFEEYKKEHDCLVEEINKIKDIYPLEAEEILNEAQTILSNYQTLIDGDGEKTNILSSHPSNQERIKYLRERILRDYKETIASASLST